MRRIDTSRTLLFKTIIAAGVALGIILLAQTIWSYFYVSQNMVLQEARTASMSRAQAVAAATRDVDPADKILLSAIIEDRIDEGKNEVAWIQITDARGKILATAGTIPKDRLTAAKSAAALKPPQPLPDVADTPMGRVVIAHAPLTRPVRGALRTPANAAAPQAEVAVYIDSVTQSLAFLLRYLILGVSASLVLMGSLIFIAVRFNRYVRGQQIEGQLELARRVQADMLPARSHTIGRIDFAADCIAAWDVGGDFCDVFNLGSGGRVAFVLGDVSGKGISAALLMALIHGAIQSLSWARSTADHELASRSLNALLCRKTATERFASMFWGYFDPEASVLRYVNAGHPPPLLFRRGDGGEICVLKLESGGPVLGLLPEGQYQQGEQAIHATDLLVTFSDGIVEAPNGTNEDFSEQRLIDVVRNAWHESPEAIRDAVLSEIRTFIKNSPVADDQTLIVVRFN